MTTRVELEALGVVDRHEGHRAGSLVDERRRRPGGRSPPGSRPATARPRDPSYSAATRTISSRFSIRPWASKVPSRVERVAQARSGRAPSSRTRSSGLPAAHALARASASSAAASADGVRAGRAGGPDHLGVARRASATGSAVGGGEGLELRRRAPGPEAALGRPEHAGQADPVGGVGHHPQVGQQVAHLGPLVEARAAHDAGRARRRRTSWSSIARLWALVR